MRLHIIKKGESLAMLSARYLIPTCMILRANPDTVSFTAGAKLQIPPQQYCMQQGSCSPAQPTGEHILGQGESLFSVAEQYGLTVHALMAHNHIHSAGEVVQGAHLFLPDKPANTSIHRVTFDQSFEDVAGMYSMRLDILMEINGIKKGHAPYPGMELYVHAPQES